MLVSRISLQSWPTLSGANNPYYFVNRSARDSYFNTISPKAGDYCAVGGDPNREDWTIEEWEVDRYDGANWATVNLSKNFALITTNAGIAALSAAAIGQYKLEISRIVIKQTPIAAGEDVSTWTSGQFINSNGYVDICLDTNNLGNPTFTLADNLTYRTNLLNGGIQFTVELGLDCLGQQSGDVTTNTSPTLTEFKVAVIGLYVKNQNSASEDDDILFAIANLPTVVEKLANTPTRVGNSLKFYLNTTLSNLGNVINLQTIHSSVGSVPEVITEDDLNDAFDAGVTSPYNLYVVDNYNDTNIPAIAVRKGNPTSATYPVRWTYFTPTDDTLNIDSSALSTNPPVKNYMVVSWDSSSQKYVPTDSRVNDTLAGLYTNNYIIYAGKVTNNNVKYNYKFTWNNSSAVNYQVDDVLTTTCNGVTFTITVIAVDDSTGKPIQFYVTPFQGVPSVNGTNLDVVYASGSSYTAGQGLKVSINSIELDTISWNFPTAWINKPLFADYNHEAGEPKGTTWASYCAEAGLPTSTAKDRRGLLTNVENLWTGSHFVGWCMNETTIKLALDLRNEATFASYGTTRYATHAETANPAANTDAYEVTSIVPRNLKRNYFQITMPNISETDANINLTNDGHDRAHAITVDTYTKFTKSIECTGTDLNGVAFKGTAYRALWADLAEFYRSDRVYPAGTLVCIGDGLAEITIAKTECNGIISTNPGYELGDKKDDHDLPVALVGKVPVLFAKDCMPKFGDRIYLSKTEEGKASTIPFGKCLGKIIDKRDELHKYSTLMCSVRIDF